MLKKLFFLLLSAQKDLIVGGQAVMEGVMMRTPGAYAIAVRRKNGTIVRMAERLPKWGEKYKPLNAPVLRGAATLGQAMALGVKALNFSARIYEEDLKTEKAAAREKALASEAVFADGIADESFTKAPIKISLPARANAADKPKQSLSAVGSIIFALIFNALLFIVAPLVLTNVLFIQFGWADAPVLPETANWFEIFGTYLREIKPHSWIAFNLVDGIIRTSFFVTMIFSMSFQKDIRRVFEYHGAEHKTIFAWEKGLNLTVENAKKQSRLHPRCGTSFLMVVMLVAVVLFSVVKFDVLWLNLLVRIALMPLVAGLSYEVIRYAARTDSSRIFKLMTVPGLWLQLITTQEPDDAQLEVAIRSLEESLKLEPAEIAA